jgi:hypothetical protein
VGLTNLGSESETCVGSRVHLVGVSISFEKNFYRLPFTPPLFGSPYPSFTSNNAEWERGWFYLHKDEPGLPSYIGKVLKEKADSWWHGVSPSSR